MRRARLNITADTRFYCASATFWWIYSVCSVCVNTMSRLGIIFLFRFVESCTNVCARPFCQENEWVKSASLSFAFSFFYSFLLGVSSYFTINFYDQRRCNCPINISCKMNWTNEHTTHNTLTHTNTQYSISFNFIINHEVHWIRHFLYCWISFCLFFFSYTLYFLQCGATRQPHHNRRHHRWMTQLHNNHRIKKNRVFNFNGPGSQ